MNQTEIPKLEVRIEQNTLKQIVDAVSSLVTESTFDFNHEGLAVKTFDPTRVSLIDVGIHNRHFERFVTSGSKIGLRLESFAKYVNEFDKTELVNIEQIGERQIQIQGDKLQIKIKTLDPSLEDQPLPRIPYDATITFKPNNLQNFIKELKRLAKLGCECVILTTQTEDKDLILKAKNDDGDLVVKISIDGLEVKGDSETMYSLEYLNQFLKTVQKERMAMLDFSTQKPLRIRIPLDNTDHGYDAHIDYYLAPRVEY